MKNNMEFDLFPKNNIFTENLGMTAIVGVLNKQAIAIAADSAETVGKGIKIYNKANKIFTLSKRHPVGIAIYGSASFNCLVPWEIVIKSFRKQLGSSSKKKIKDYADSFLDYLKGFCKQYIPTEDTNRVVCGEVLNLFRSAIINALPNSDSDNFTIDPRDLPLLRGILIDINNGIAKNGKTDIYSSLRYNSFVDIISGIIPHLESCIQKASGVWADYNILVLDTLYNIYTSKDYNRNYTGIAFFGYGDNDIYPEIYSIKIYNCLNNTSIIWEIDNMVEINHSKNPSAYIYPMAQTDVMEAYMSGIDPLIKETFISATKDVFKQVFSNVSSFISNNIDLDGIMLTYRKFINDFTYNNKFQPLLYTVATMEKEDLAELAENLIYLTSLQRRIMPNMETVGGPVDVAIISKGDGFIWIKRKHYFDPALNNSFFDNYYNNIENK